MKKKDENRVFEVQGKKMMQLPGPDWASGQAEQASAKALEAGVGMGMEGPVF